MLRDGEGIVVPMMLRDSAHGGLSEYHAQALAASARSNAAALEEAQRQHDVMQAVRDHHGNAADLAYAESVAAFDRKHNEA
ncbi:MAG: hypothetical protein J0H15_04980 [Xanthomonadales bacterium]|nr:hypothetical protein [Xanthomonadales bacterium]